MASSAFADEVAEGARQHLAIGGDRGRSSAIAVSSVTPPALAR
jgi:hypothetical protein